MRILITTGIFPPDIGGPASYVAGVAEALSARGHEIAIVTLSADRKVSEPGKVGRIVSVRRGRFKPARWWETTSAIARLRRNVDVVFANGLIPEAIVANCLNSVPMVLKVVGDPAWERAQNRRWVQDDFETFQRRRYTPKIEVLKTFRAWCIRRSDAVIVPSEFLARSVATWGVNRHKLRVIHNAVPARDFIAAAQIPLATAVKVAAVARLVPWKGVDGIIRAVATLRDVGLVIIGDGPEYARLSQLARRSGVGDRVYFAGARDHCQTLSLMAACDVFVLNSTYEGFPHALLEAMDLGLAVIATPAGGTREIVTDGVNGKLARGSSSSLGAVLATISESPTLRRELGANARKRARMFTYKQMIDETEAVLAEAAARG